MKWARRAALAITGLLLGLLVGLMFLSTMGLARPMMSNSMHTAGHVIFIAPMGSYEVGDAIMFYTPDPNAPPVTTHRIVEVTQEGFVTKGDARGAPDDWIVPRESVIGRQIFTIPHLAELLLRHERVMLSLVLLTGAFVACLRWRVKAPRS